MQKIVVPLLICLSFLLSAGCVYKAGLAQGNLLKQEDLEQVEIGMTRNQIRFLLGTPMIDDPFHRDRWDYIYFLRIGRKPATAKRWVSIHFEEGAVTQIEKELELNPNL